VHKLQNSKLTPQSVEEVEEFITRHDVDDKAAMRLRLLAPEQQAEVMKQGLANARNPSAKLTALIAELDRQESPQSVLEVEEFITRQRSVPGAERGRLVQDIRAYINHAAEQGAYMSAIGGRFRVNCQFLAQHFIVSDQSYSDAWITTGPTEDEVSDFIGRHRLEDRCARALRESSPSIQAYAMQHFAPRGPVHKSNIFLKYLESLTRNGIRT